MVLTRATDYAVRILTALSSAPAERVKTDALATATSVPKDYISKVITPLVRRGWVQSYRGAGGGFSLVDRGQSITLLEVVELFEGAVHLQPCTGPKGCQFTPRCPAHTVWCEAETELCRVLAKYNIAELAARSRCQGLFIPGE
ncbi:MAG: RrF2 family transcriptional regulator [Acidobacteriota bacterium]